jgi:hypothetical protein
MRSGVRRLGAAFCSRRTPEELLGTMSALLICFVIAALHLFLREVFLATSILRIGPP